MKNNSSQESPEEAALGLLSPGKRNNAVVTVSLDTNSGNTQPCQTRSSQANCQSHWKQSQCRISHQYTEKLPITDTANHRAVNPVDMETLVDKKIKRFTRGLSSSQEGISGNPINTCLYDKVNIPVLSCARLLPVVQCLLVVICLNIATLPVTAHPLMAEMRAMSRKDEYSYQPMPMDSTMYLSKFGYLPKSDMETGALRNASELKKAVKKFQVMAHLPVTGKLDQATIDMMSQPRCGMADNVDTYIKKGTQSRSKRYVLGPSTWPTHDLTYRIMNYTPDLQMHQTRDAIERALKVWTDATKLTFTEVFHGTADMEIKFAHMYHHDGYPFDGKGLTLAHAFFPGLDEGGDVHFDEDEEWTVGTHEGLNLFTVAAHEMGHALGLAHSSVQGSLMYPWYQGYTPDLQLHSDDLVAIQYLYGSNDKTDPGHRPTTTRPPVNSQRPTYVTVPPAFTTTSPRTTTTQSTDHSPDPCTTDIDAAVLIRQEAYFFKGVWFWRVNREGIMDSYPVKLDRFWYGLPDEVQHIDAAYERVDDGKILFFSGKRYWMYAGNYMDTGFPREGRPLTALGFPDDIDHIDAAYVWGYNSKTYFVTGSMYWRYNEDTQEMDYDYPRDMSMWGGVPVPVDAAFQHWDGNTYFLQGQYYWKFQDALMRTEPDYPKRLGPFWLECDKNVGGGRSTVIPVFSGGVSHHRGTIFAFITQLCIGFLVTCSIQLKYS